MKRDGRNIKRVSAIVLMISGIVFGVTWKRTGFCFGDLIFSALDLPVWSGGMSGTHYPAIVGMIMILLGIGIWNTTLSKRARYWTWGTVIMLLLTVGLLSSLGEAA